MYLCSWSKIKWCSATKSSPCPFLTSLTPTWEINSEWRTAGKWMSSHSVTCSRCEGLNTDSMMCVFMLFQQNAESKHSVSYAIKVHLSALCVCETWGDCICSSHHCSFTGVSSRTAALLHHLLLLFLLYLLTGSSLCTHTRSKRPLRFLIRSCAHTNTQQVVRVTGSLYLVGVACYEMSGSTVKYLHTSTWSLYFWAPNANIAQIQTRN